MNKGYELGPTEITPTNGSISRTMNNFGGDMLWHPMKMKNQDWVDFKALEFAWEESEGSQMKPI